MDNLFFLLKIVFNSILAFFLSWIFVYKRTKISQFFGIQKVPKMEFSYWSKMV